MENKVQPTSAAEMIPPTDGQKKVFFPNLDALRFFSFFGVFLFHCLRIVFPYLKNSNPVLYDTFYFLFRNGNLGVNFFFVLSGFLITYLLLEEKSFSGTISLPKFYMRRILRIWPLFYLCVFVGFVVFPVLKTMAGGVANEPASIWYYLFFINNFDFIRQWPATPDAVILVVLWSVAVEEQFYLGWPVIMKLINRKWLLVPFLIVIIGSLLFRWFHQSDSPHDYALRYFHSFSLIGDMAVGATLALLVNKRGAVYRLMYMMKPALASIIYLAAILVTLFKQEIFAASEWMVFERLVLASLYGFIIVNQSIAAKPFFRFSRMKKISKLGTYTYGLYCWHFFVISIVVALSGKMKLSLENWTLSITVTIFALLASIVLSITSYNYFESWFLRLKSKFAIIVR